MSQALTSPTLVSNWPKSRLFQSNPGFVPGFFLAVKYPDYDAHALMARDDVRFSVART
jgi:hypothetical protein